MSGRRSRQSAAFLKVEGEIVAAMTAHTRIAVTAVDLDLPDGQWIHALSLDPPDPTGLPVVLLHGFMGGAVTWLPVLPHLADCRVLVLDLPGFAGSARTPPPRPMTAESVDEYFLPRIRAAIQQAGITAPFVLGGHSFGGHLAARYAAVYAADVASLVLVDPWGLTRRWTHEESAASVAGASLVFRIGWGLKKALGSFPPLALMRSAALLGPDFQTRLVLRRAGHFEKLARWGVRREAFAAYFVACNTAAPTGECVFMAACDPTGEPLTPAPLAADGPVVHVVFGEDTWMDVAGVRSLVGSLARERRGRFDVAAGAGHQVLLERPGVVGGMLAHAARRVAPGMPLWGPPVWGAEGLGAGPAVAEGGSDGEDGEGASSGDEEESGGEAAGALQCDERRAVLAYCTKRGCDAPILK